MKKYFHIIFGLYVFLVLALWSLPRVCPFERCVQIFNLHGIHYGFYKSLYNALYLRVPNHSPLLVVVFSLFLFLFCLLLPYFLKLFKLEISGGLTKVQLPVASAFYISFGVMIVIFVLIVKEIIDPFYFVQDDNHPQFFPKILVGLDMLFSGQLPFIDNYQHFGAPLFEIGTYAVFDPLMIISYLIGKFALGNAYTTLEIYAMLSIIVGATFFGLSLRILKVDGLTATAAIISYSLAPFFLIVGRSWYYTLGIVSYVPILFYFFLSAIYKKQDWQWFLSVSVLRGFYFYTGNAQFFLYGILIESVAYLYTSISTKRYKLFLRYLLSLIFTIGLILPLLAPQFLSLNKVPRGKEWLLSDEGIPFDSFVSSFLPYPITNMYHMHAPAGGNPAHMSNLWHIGILWIMCFYIGLALYIGTGKGRFIPLLILAVFILFLSGGTASLIYPLKYCIPILNKMTKAFKIFPFAEFLIILYGALIINKIRELLIFKRVLIYPIILNILVTVLVAIFGTNTSLCTFPEKPYPKLWQPLVSKLNKNDFIYTFGWWRYDGKPYVTTLVHNYSCLYDLMCANYYDPLLPTKIREPRGDLKRYFEHYGITKVIFHKIGGVSNSHMKYAPAMRIYPILYEDNFIILYDTGDQSWILKQIDGPTLETRHEVVKYDRSKIKSKIYSPYKTRWEYHNEYRDGYYLLVNRKKTKIYPGNSGFCSFELLPSKKMYDIEIGYRPPFFVAWITIGFIVASLAFFAYKRFIV